MKVLREGLSSGQSGQWTGGTPVEGVGLDVDGVRAVVLDNGLLGRGAGGDKSSAHDGSEELHIGG